MVTRLFEPAALDLDDDIALSEIAGMRERVGAHLRTPRRWAGGLRRTAQARAIRGSNSIEGYHVSEEDALAAVDDVAPMTADERTWTEVQGYRRVLTYVLTQAGEPEFRLDSQTLRSMHFMLLEHDLAKSPGRYRTGDIFVVREDTGERVYEGPPPEQVGRLMELLEAELAPSLDLPPLVAAAMAHLNLVMIHPFRDGNGRMARALQTLVLGRGNAVDPIFSSIEEWLGSNTEDYYAVLAHTGRGRWQPEGDTRSWIKFTLRAHHMQAQTFERRIEEATLVGQHIEELLVRHGLPERAFDPLFEAALGLPVRRPGYVKRAVIEDRTASRDLRALVAAGLLEAHGHTRGRQYVAGENLRDVGREIRRRRTPLTDPYPGLMADLRARRRPSR